MPEEWCAVRTAASAAKPASQERTKKTAKSGGRPGGAWRGVLPWAAGAAVLGLALVALAGGFERPSPAGGGEAAGGSAWKIGAGDFHALVFDPADDRRAFAGTHQGLFITEDGGETWRQAGLGGDIMGLAASAARPGRLYAGIHLGFAVSEDGGRTWRASRELASADVHGLALADGDPGRLYAFVVGRGLLRSEDGGGTWTEVSAELPQSTHGLAVLAGRAAGEDVIWAGTMEKGVLVSRDGGRTWTTLAPLGAMVMGLSYDARGGRLLATTDRGVLVSADEGGTWQPLGVADAVAAAVSPSRPDVILAVDGWGRVYRSEDGGRTWSGGAASGEPVQDRFVPVGTER